MRTLNGDGMSTISANQALELLREGNRRFASGRPNIVTPEVGANINERISGRRPFAIVLGCSDARVPVEMVFDQGLGDLFVVRVAGNIAAPSQIGSIELAAERYGTRLVVVLGHSRCWAVLATLEELRRPSGNQSPNLRALVDRVRPSVEALLAAEPGCDPDALVRSAVRSNVRTSVDQLRRESEILRRLVEKGDLLIVGAEYSLETGVVDFFDGVPEIG